MSKLISYVLPVYNEAEGIREFFTRLKQVTTKLAPTYNVEFVFVNDGSRDNSLEILLQLESVDSTVKVIDLSRNFGHQAAITAGIDLASGDAVIIMDTDLQDPPEISLDLITKWEQGYDVVYAQRNSRDDRWMKRLTSYWYYRVLGRLSDVEIPPDTGDFRLMDRKVVDVIKGFREYNRYMRGLVSFVGFSQIAVLFDRDARFAGHTGYSVSKMLKLATDGIASFSLKPLHLLITLGAGINLVGIISLIAGFVMWQSQARPFVAQTLLISAVLLIVGGINLIGLGILGVYVGRIYREVQNRPIYIKR